MNDITFIIKTFERPYCIKRLVKSIYYFYPDAIVLIGDDSEKSCADYLYKKYPDKRIQVFDLPKDCGLSYGRNFLLKKVDTEYFLLLDDDFVFDKKTDIEIAKDIFKKNNLDILGGYIRNYKTINHWYDWLIIFGEYIFNYELPSNYLGNINFDEVTHTLYVDYFLHEFPDYQETDIVLNFFIGNTKNILNKCLWDEELKLQEHTAFFFNAKKNGVKVAATNKFSIRHMPIRMKKYNSFRGRDFVSIFMKKNNILKIVSTKDGKEVKVRELNEI